MPQALQFVTGSVLGQAVRIGTYRRWKLWVTAASGPEGTDRACRRTSADGTKRILLESQSTGGRSVISWHRYSDSSAVLACVSGPISPHPRHQSWECTGTSTAPVPLPQQRAAGAKKCMLIGSHPPPPPAFNRGKVPIPRRPRQQCVDPDQSGLNWFNASLVNGQIGFVLDGTETPENPPKRHQRANEWR